MLFKRKKKEVLSLFINAEKCCGCGECVDFCRHKVLDVEYGANRDIAKIINPGNCVGCGKCSWYCMADAIELTLNHSETLMPELR